MTTLEAILALIPQLDPAEIPKVRAALQGLSSMTRVMAQLEPIDNDWLLPGIALYLTDQGYLPGRGSITLLQKRDAYRTYRKKLPDVMVFLTRVSTQVENKTRHRPTLSLLCARSLAELLQRWDRFTVSAMLSQIDKIPEALDCAYPGYLKAGLYNFVLGADR